MLRFNLNIKAKVLGSMFLLIVISSVVLTIVAVTKMQNTVVETVLEKAKADLATGEQIVNLMYPGDWAIRDGKLYKGSQLINENYEAVDKVAELTNDTVTIFQGNTRVATTVIRDGQRAINTQVSPEVEEAVLVKGESFYGEVDVVGVKYQTAYKPIRDAAGEIIGIWYVGVSKKFVDEQNNSFIFVMIIASTVICILGLALAWTMSATITKPILRLKEAMECAEQGDLSREVHISSSDEVGTLSQSYNKMMSNLRALILEITKASEEMASTGGQFSANANEVARATQEVARAIEEVAKGNSEQTRSISDTYQTVNSLGEAIKKIEEGAGTQAADVNRTVEIGGQMFQDIDDVAQNADLVSDSANDTYNAAKQGGEAVQKVISGMDQIKNTVFESAKRIQELGNHSQQIGEIIQVIDDIAEQTNLLALNAAIEAARAGEHGKGFAVVADEVRKLAERSSKATKEIANLISNMQKGITNAVTAMDAGTNEVEGGASLAADAGEALNRILTTVDATNNQIQKISEAAQKLKGQSSEVMEAIEKVAVVTSENTYSTMEMAKESDKVLKSISTISSIAQESAASAEEVSASTEEMTASSQEIAASAQSLAKTGEELRQVVATFKLK